MSEETQRQRRKLSAILMADVVGFSRMMGADEERATALIQAFHERVRGLVEKNQGRIVDTAGDSVFGEFDSVLHAVRCAQEIQDAQSGANRGQPSDRRIDTRIGVHLGDVIVEDYRVYGDGVNIAARLEEIADPGGICISEAVYQQVQSKLDLSFEDLGVRELKNIQHPIRLYRVAGAHPTADKTPMPPTPHTERRFREELLSHRHLPLGVIGAGLLLAPLFLFPTAGVLPTGGAILIALALGGAWRRTSGQSSRLLIALGIGIASGAVFTDWSGVTNALFVLGGAVVASVGVSQQYASRG